MRYPRQPNSISTPQRRKPLPRSVVRPVNVSSSIIDLPRGDVPSIGQVGASANAARREPGASLNPYPLSAPAINSRACSYCRCSPWVARTVGSCCGSKSTNARPPCRYTVWREASQRNCCNNCVCVCRPFTVVDSRSIQPLPRVMDSSSR
jgi:hypothetical protein